MTKARKIFVCSPFAGDIARNTAVAVRMCRHVLAAGHVPFAAHLLYPRMLREEDPAEREQGLRCGHTFLAVCDEIWVLRRGYEGDISAGMAREIAQAIEFGIPVVEVSEAEISEAS